MKRRAHEERDSTKELTILVQQACLVAKDAASNLLDYIENSSKMALLAIRDCEKELDRMERQVDQQITGAITGVSESEARQLLACLKFIIDLERIGDLTWSVAQRLQALMARRAAEDTQDLSAMARMLQAVLDRVHQGFVARDLASATWVLQQDPQMDQTYRALFNRHVQGRDRGRREYSTNVLLMAQALERAGDHAKNLGEELVHLVEGRSVRHERKKSQTATHDQG
jgi:phosphate transport system protein